MKISLIVISALTFVAFGCGRGDLSTSRAESQPASASTNAARREGNLVLFDVNSPQIERIRSALVEETRAPVEELSAPGKVELNPGRVSRVSLPVAGRIREVLVNLGDSVRQGQTIMRLESPDASTTQSAWRQGEANISQAKAAVAKAEADWTRAQDLFDNRAIAQKEVLAAETALAQAKASLDQATALRDDALAKLHLLGLLPDVKDQPVNVLAPVPGKVVEISVAAGEYRTDTAMPVMTIADLSTVWVAADIPETAIRFIRIGESVSIAMSAFPDRAFTGRVTGIADLVDPQTRTIKVRAELDNSSGQFRPEMFATVRHSQGARPATVIPKSALFQQQDRTTVFRERNRGEFEELAVRVLWQDNNRAAVQSELRAGDRVVVDGVAQLKAY
jgi:cobalt-zinc-cadmium efflux system membrane fusion protein